MMMAVIITGSVIVISCTSYCCCCCVWRGTKLSRKPEQENLCSSVFAPFVSHPSLIIVYPDTFFVEGKFIIIPEAVVSLAKGTRNFVSISSKKKKGTQNLTSFQQNLRMHFWWLVEGRKEQYQLLSPRDMTFQVNTTQPLFLGLPSVASLL